MGKHCAAVIMIFICIAFGLLGPTPVAAESPYAQWSRGPSTDPSYFPIGVWLQAPRSEKVAAYSGAGFNLYIACSWDETEAGMNRLRNAGMRIFLSQTGDYAPTHMDDPVIAGWLQQDEPDNAQPNPSGGYYSPVAPLPSTTWSTCPTLNIYTQYLNKQAVDPTRPIFMNLGQGVAWDGWIGRGTRTNHPEDYPEYALGCDIVSYDIYPGASDRPETEDKFWLVAFGVDRLIAAAKPNQPVWNCIECTKINSTEQASPEEVKAEVWMSIIHGSMGLVWFVHTWVPTFDEDGLLADPVMLAAVSDINWQVRSLAPMLNSPTLVGEVNTSSSNPGVPIDTMVKRVDEINYVFSVSMRNGATTGTYYGPNFPPLAVAQVIGEDREIPITAGWFTDDFDPYEVHLYRILSRFPGDTDGDGDVDLDDFVLLKQSFGLASGAEWNQGDFDDDGDVDLDDFVVLKQNFGFDTTP